MIGGSAVGLIVIILLCWGGWRWAGARAEEKARARERVALVPDTYRAIHPCVVAFSDLRSADCLPRSCGVAVIACGDDRATN